MIKKCHVQPLGYSAIAFSNFWQLSSTSHQSKLATTDNIIALIRPFLAKNKVQKTAQAIYAIALISQHTNAFSLSDSRVNMGLSSNGFELGKDPNKTGLSVRLKHVCNFFIIKKLPFHHFIRHSQEN